MAQGPALHDRTAAAILDAAATVLAERGQAATMADVAAASGVGRATLYRYFASREELVSALVAAAVDDARRHLDDAHPDEVPVPEALARMARALVAVGTKFAVLMDERTRQVGEEAKERLGDAIRRVLERGVAEGVLRRDLSVEWMAQLFGGLLMAAVQTVSRRETGVEEAAGALTALFLDGARPRTD